MVKDWFPFKSFLDFEHLNHIEYAKDMTGSTITCSKKFLNVTFSEKLPQESYRGLLHETLDKFITKAPGLSIGVMILLVLSLFLLL